MSNHSHITLADDGEHGTIDDLVFRHRGLHEHLASIPEERRPAEVLDVLAAGAEIVVRANHHGSLTSLTEAVDRLDRNAKRVVDSVTKEVDRTLERSLSELAETLEAADGPLAGLFDRFDPGADGNVIDQVRELVARSIRKATNEAVRDLTEANQETLERLTRTVADLETVAAAEKARLEEAERGTAKGLDHEAEVESLLGELVSVTGDGLDDVSTVIGLAGDKKGDKVIRVRGGCAIVTEDKRVGKAFSEARARALLDEAQANRGAELGLLIVDHESKIPGNQPFHLIDDDKAVVVAERLPLRLVFCLFRARAIERAAAATAVDDATLLADVEAIHRLVASIERHLAGFQTLRTDHTKASNALQHAVGVTRELTDGIASDVAEIVAVIERLVDDGPEDTAVAA